MRTVQRIIEERGGIERLREHAIALENPPYMRLCIEHIGTGPRGLPMVSVCHYGQQNGDAMRAPDLVCEVATDGLQGWRWLPVSFRNDYLGVDQEACFTDEQGRIMIRPALVRDLASFARTWDGNIREQGFAMVRATA